MKFTPITDNRAPKADYEYAFDCSGHVVIQCKSNFFRGIQVCVNREKWDAYLKQTKPHSGYSVLNLAANHFWLTT